jgi:hypothetical protein
MEKAMKPHAPETDITRRLQQAIDKLHEDVRRIEVWAGALNAFAQPVPEYHPSNDFLLRATPVKGPLEGRQYRALEVRKTP